MSCVELVLRKWKALNISIAQSQSTVGLRHHKSLPLKAHCTVGKFHLYPLLSKQWDYIKQFILGEIKTKKPKQQNTNKLNHELIVLE